MPEWPEMENYRSLLAERIAGDTITGVEVEREKSINISIEAFREALVGRTILHVERRAKYLNFHLDNGKRLLLHLMLGGAIHYSATSDKPARTVQVTLHLSGGSVYFVGLRLGYIHLLGIKDVAEQFAELGPEPLSRWLDANRFRERFKGRRSALKSALVNQQLIAGIGNCYADEIAHAAGLRPTALLSDLNDGDWERLYASMHKVLEEAYAMGGYMDDPLSPDDTKTGGFYPNRAVYDREGEPCPRCNGTIVMEKVNSRKAYYCPQCQPAR